MRLSPSARSWSTRSASARFSAETARGLRSPYPGDAFMALELKPGALRAKGTVRYAAAFGALPVEDHS
jgi:putative acetyltransferase